jgi:hypothetical protein
VATIATIVTIGHVMGSVATIATYSACYKSLDVVNANMILWMLAEEDLTILTAIARQRA